MLFSEQIKSVENTNVMKHTIQSLDSADGVMVVGDIGYYNAALPRRSELTKLAKWLPKKEWFKQATKCISAIQLSEGTHQSGFMALELLHLAREQEAWRGPIRRNTVESHLNGDPLSSLCAINEPEWMDNLPHTARRWLRAQHVYGEHINPISIVPSFPLMGYSYFIPEDTMIEQANWLFNIERLRRIKQLSFLHDPVGKSTDRSVKGMMFDHTRYLHVTDVVTVANLIGSNIGLGGSLLNTLNTAAFTHDTLTPAGGDSVKLVDPAAFDEDAHYPELLVGEEWEAYRNRYGIDRDILVNTINGEGLLGRILDIADKSSYLARDTVAYLGAKQVERKYFDAAYCTIAELVEDDQNICAMWESAYRRGDSLVFGDVDRLKKFLTLRALIFRHLYYNPMSRFFEYLVGNGVVKYLYRNGLVTRDDLLREDDHWIERKVEEVLQSPFVLHNMHNLEKARIEECADLESALVRAEEYDNDPSLIAIIDQFNPVTSNGTKKFAVNHEGSIKTFHDACPEESDQIERIMKFNKLVCVYIFVASDLSIPDGSRKRVKDILKSVRALVP